MKKKDFFAVAMAGLLLFIFGFARLAPSQTPKEPERIDAGKLFDKYCKKCHGQDGRAKTFKGKLVGARDLTNYRWQANISDAEIGESIRKGPKAMPAYEEKLSSAEIETLVGYVRGLKGTDK
jgi:mono/diheme cytochrome c family protein